jgi:AAA domain
MSTSLDASGIDGATFAFGGTSNVTPIWGNEQDVLWADGEPLMIAAPQGVGKTTLCQALILARIGVRTPSVLGYDVQTAPHQRVLYIAADRPKQAARSLRRMVNDADRKLLAERLAVWRGPLPFDLTRSTPEVLALFVERHKADTVAIDSLKDIAVGLSDDAVGAKVNLALQACIARGIQVVTNHHQRKSNAENKRPQTLDDVYGSTWLTAGTGSVLLLTGQPSDPVVTLHHLKSPENEIGPLSLEIDFHRGEFTIRQSATITGLLHAATDGLDASSAARQMYETSSPTPAQVEKVRRKLRELVTKGHAVEIRGAKPKDPVRWQTTRVIPRDTDREASRNPSRPITNPPTTASRQHHAASRLPLSPTAPPFKGAVDENVKQEADDELDRLRTKHPDLEGLPQ